MIETIEDLRHLGRQLLTGFKITTKCPVHNENRYAKSIKFDGDGIHIEWLCVACHRSGVYNVNTTVNYTEPDAPEEPHGHTHEEPETELERDHAGNGTTD